MAGILKRLLNKLFPWRKANKPGHQVRRVRRGLPPVPRPTGPPPPQRPIATSMTVHPIDAGATLQAFGLRVERDERQLVERFYCSLCGAEILVLDVGDFLYPDNQEELFDRVRRARSEHHCHDFSGIPHADFPAREKEDEVPLPDVRMIRFRRK